MTTEWNPNEKPFRATVVYSTNQPGLHGWYSRSEVFATLDEALLVAAVRFPRGVQDVRVSVAKNRDTWNEGGENDAAPGCPGRVGGWWEEVGSRASRKDFRWGKGWNQARANKVAAFLACK